VITFALVSVFAVVALTGPAGRDWRAARRALRDRPLARVAYLPSAGCRAGEPI
jgi:hypothetical protein